VAPFQRDIAGPTVHVVKFEEPSNDYKFAVD
jgi:hypothetical protein